MEATVSGSDGTGVECFVFHDETADNQCGLSKQIPTGVLKLY